MTAYIISHLNQIKHGFGIKIFFCEKNKDMQYASILVN